ncbi:MAG: hypothetical protein ACI9W6_000143, partial [Motiliproteus sp.]
RQFSFISPCWSLSPGALERKIIILVPASPAAGSSVSSLPAGH